MRLAYHIHLLFEFLAWLMMGSGIAGVYAGYQNNYPILAIGGITLAIVGLISAIYYQKNTTSEDYLINLLKKIGINISKKKDGILVGKFNDILTEVKLETINAYGTGGWISEYLRCEMWLVAPCNSEKYTNKIEICDGKVVIPDKKVASIINSVINSSEIRNLSINLNLTGECLITVLSNNYKLKSDIKEDILNYIEFFVKLRDEIRKAYSQKKQDKVELECIQALRVYQKKYRTETAFNEGKNLLIIIFMLVIVLFILYAFGIIPSVLIILSLLVLFAVILAFITTKLR